MAQEQSLVVDQDVDYDLWSVERAYANDPDYVDTAQSFAAAQLSVALSSHPERSRIIDSARRIVGALFANATRTRAPLIRLNLCVDHDLLRIDVEDHRRGFPTCTPINFDAPTAQAVTIIKQLALRWNCEPTVEGKHVWAEIALA
jgi:hypothetical protein